VQWVRTSLGADQIRFAQLMGVHPTTAYRWEAKEHLAQPLKIEPFQLQILAVLKQQLEARQTTAERAKFAEAVLQGLLIGGGLFALFRLLQVAFEPDARKPQRRAKNRKRPA
jgi:hypothetical protein